MKSFGAVLVVLLVTFVVGACGAVPEAQTPRATEQPVITGTPADFNADDMAFAGDMVSSYKQTSVLTALVPERSTNPNLLALTADIDAALKPDLETVKVFLVQWNSSSDTGAGPNESAGTVPGLVDDATIARLNSLTGKEFDTLWLQSMIGHATGAIEVAKTEIAKGANVDALATAKRVVQTQQAEVDRMQRLFTAS